MRMRPFLGRFAAVAVCIGIGNRAHVIPKSVPDIADLPKAPEPIVQRKGRGKHGGGGGRRKYRNYRFRELRGLAVPVD